jgi:hypothetical protein
MNANDWTEAALAKYIVTNPELKDEIANLPPKDQQDQIRWAFEDEAEAQGIETWELALTFIAETPEQLKTMRLEAHKEAAQTLGIDWDEYRAANAIAE